jgi:predicted nucleic acid-binding protein
MVLVDTSIWISLYRKQNSELAQKLWVLAARNEAAVSGQVWVEFLGGFRKQSVRSDYQSKLRAYPFLETTRMAYDLAVEFLALQPRLGAGDAIVAATAIANRAALFTADSDFRALIPHGLILFA